MKSDTNPLKRLKSKQTIDDQDVELEEAEGVELDLNNIHIDHSLIEEFSKLMDANMQDPAMREMYRKQLEKDMQNLGLPSESVDDLLEGKLFESLAQSKYNPNSHTPTINNENMEIEELDD